MAGGSVEGGMGSFGSPNTFDVFKKRSTKKSKIKKPTVRRAKRQKRR